MGKFSIVINAVGGHGCDRNAKEGEAVVFTHAEDHETICPDCTIKQFVETLRKRDWFSYGEHAAATLTHWPGEPGEVVDDLLTDRRIKGQF